MIVCYVRADGTEGLYNGHFVGREEMGPNGPRRRFKLTSGEGKDGRTHRWFSMNKIIRVIEDGTVVYGDRPQPRKNGRFAKGGTFVQ